MCEMCVWNISVYMILTMLPCVIAPVGVGIASGRSREPESLAKSISAVEDKRISGGLFLTGDGPFLYTHGLAEARRI